MESIKYSGATGSAGVAGPAVVSSKPASPVESEYDRMFSLQIELQQRIALLSDRLDVVLAPEPNVGNGVAPSLKEVSHDSKMVNMLRTVSDLTNQSLDRINSTLDRLTV